MQHLHALNAIVQRLRALALAQHATNMRALLKIYRGTYECAHLTVNLHASCTTCFLDGAQVNLDVAHVVNGVVQISTLYTYSNCSVSSVSSEDKQMPAVETPKKKSYSKIFPEDKATIGRYESGVTKALYRSREKKVEREYCSRLEKSVRTCSQGEAKINRARDGCSCE